MVGKNYLNLLKEIQRIRKCDLIIFTTYSFDPFFFDHMLVRSLRENNPHSDIIVLVDEEHVNRESATEITGVEYPLIQIPSTFHPKLFIFCGERGVTTFIGSHNLTLTGFTYNLELSCKIINNEFSEKCLSYVGSVLSQFLEPNHKLLEKISKHLGQENQPADGQPFVQLLQNLDKPILSQVLEIIESRKIKFEEITIVAPFFSSVRQLVQELHKKTCAKKINLCVQLKNHNLDVDTVDDLPYINFMKTMPKDKRPLHCKVLLFHNKQNPLLLMGSPNFTQAAMMKASKNMGNYEIAVLMEETQVGFKDLFSELKLSKVSKNKIRETKIIERPKESKEKKYVHLFLAEYKSLQLEIALIVLESVANSELNIESPSGELRLYHKTFNLDHNQKKIIVDLYERPELGSSIWLSLSGKRISNKVSIAIPQRYELIDFNQKNFDKISSMIGSSDNLNELLQIMLKLFPFESEITTEITSKTLKKYKKHPISTRYKSSYRMKMLDLLEKWFRVHHTKPTVGGEPSEKKPPKPKSPPTLNETSVKERTCKIIRRFAKVFETTKLCDDNSDAIYCLFILLSMKICEKICALFDLREEYDELLLYSLGIFETMWKRNKVSGSTIRLLSLLIYLEEQGFRINSRVMDEIIEGSSINPTSLPHLIQTLDLKIIEVQKFMKSMSLNVAQEKNDIYSARTVDLLWVNNSYLLWKSLSDTKKLVKNLAADCFPLIHGNIPVPFTTLFGATVGKDMELSELKVYYNRWPNEVSNEGYPLFKVGNEQREKILNCICQRLVVNLYNSYSKLNNKKLLQPILNKRLEHFVRKNAENHLFSISTKNKACLVNLGKVFCSIDPKCS